MMPSPPRAPARTFNQSTIPAANVSTVPQRSPLRYPGGKTWLVPHVRRWLGSFPAPASFPRLLVEPFAGGGIVSLTAVMEYLAHRAVMVELDRDVAAFWRATLESPSELVSRVRDFSLTRASVERLTRQPPQSVQEHGFRTLVLNRTRRGGILAPGAALVREGENGAGVRSRWYPDTIARRIEAIAEWSDRLLFLEGDGVQVMEMMGAAPGAVFFIDPPYTASGGKRAGSRLYAHSIVDHKRIFKTLANCQADFLMTYDCSDEIMDLVEQYGFHGAVVNMKSGHHVQLPELLITRREVFT